MHLFSDRQDGGDIARHELLEPRFEDRDLALRKASLRLPRNSNSMHALDRSEICSGK